MTKNLWSKAVTDEGEEGIEAEEEISNNIKQKSGAGILSTLSRVSQ